MRVFFITVRSVTFGQRAESVLKKGGFFVSLQRTPRWMEEQGCGYALKLMTVDIASAVSLLRENKIQLRRVYVQLEDGQMEEVIL